LLWKFPAAAAKFPFSWPLAAYNACLKFNHTFEKHGRPETSIMPYTVSWLHHLFSKLMLDVLPAALASALCGFMFTHYFSPAREGMIAHAAPASAEMMQLLRDEHALMDNYVKAEVSKERERLAAEDSAPRVAVKQPLDESPAASVTRPVAATAASKPPAPRAKEAIVEASLPPLVIAQARTDAAQPSADDAAAQSLFTKTIGIKDHVVAVTHRVVSAIGGLPSWIGSIGDRIGNGENPRPPADLVSAS
jgi:hypothetical protein